MKIPVRKSVAGMSGYVPGEQPADGSLVKLNTNENPYPPSPRVAEAVTAEVAGAMNLYPRPMADELRSKAAEVYGLDPSQVLAGNGSDELLAIAVRAATVEGESLAFAEPTYSLYETLAAIAGAHVVALDEQARVTFVCNPNSPTGAAVPRQEIEAIAGGSEGIVIADEAYVDFGADTAIPLLDSYSNLLVVRSFSKSFSLAGLRLGLAFGDSALIAELAKVKDSYNVSRLAVAAGVAALDDYAWMQANVARVKATRDRVVEELRGKGIRVADSQANFFWMECDGESGRSVHERLRAAGILVRYFDRSDLAAGVRVTVGTDEQMDAFVAALLG